MKNHSQTSSSPNALLTDMQSIVSDAENLVGGSAGEYTAEALSNLREKFEAAQERFASAYNGAKDKVVAGAKSTDVAIRENPYTAMAVALGVGILVGALIGRRTK